MVLVGVYLYQALYINFVNPYASTYFLMKLLLFLACMITLPLKTIGQDHPYDDLTTMREASTHFADSLLSRGVDTLISYYAGSASCPSVPPIAVVYWKENNMGNMLVFGVIRQSHKRKKESFSLLLEYIDGIVFGGGAIGG